MEQATKVTYPLMTFHSRQLSVNAYYPRLRQHHLTATLRMVYVPGHSPGQIGLTGQDTGVPLAVL